VQKAARIVSKGFFRRLARPSVRDALLGTTSPSTKALACPAREAHSVRSVLWHAHLVLPDTSPQGWLMHALYAQGGITRISVIASAGFVL